MATTLKSPSIYEQYKLAFPAFQSTLDELFMIDLLIERIIIYNYLHF